MISTTFSCIKNDLFNQVNYKTHFYFKYIIPQINQIRCKIEKCFIKKLIKKFFLNKIKKEKVINNPTMKQQKLFFQVLIDLNEIKVSYVNFITIISSLIHENVVEIIFT